MFKKAMFEGLSKYLSIILDYSVVWECSNGVWFDELLNLFNDYGIDCYVNDTFKVLHKCVTAQQDPKDKYVQPSMRSLMQSLLPTNKLHLINTCNTERFIELVNELDFSVLLTTKNSILFKRLIEKKPVYNHDVAILFPSGLKIYSSMQEMIDDNPPPKLSNLAKIDSFLDTDARANIGDIVNYNGGERLTLEKRLSGGAEGMVFLTDNSKLVAKIYHKGVITPLRWAKLKKLTELNITSPHFCAPQHLLYFRNVPVGYTMFIGKGTTLSNVFDGPDAILEQYPDWTRLDVCETLLSLIGKYIYLHMHDVVAGDIQLKNALIESSNSQYLIDMDSVQVGNLPCPVGTEEFTDPKLWGRDFAGFVRTLEDEDYSIAMLVFSVLFCGLHPYATRNGAETLREEILNKNFPYTLDNSETEHIPLGGYVHIWEYLPDYLRKMLYRTFKEGKSYEAVCWRDAVQQYMTELENFKYDDPEAYKLFPCEDYKQISINVEEYRAKLAEAKEQTNKAPEPKPKFEKKTFNNVPSGRFVSSSVGESSSFRPVKYDDDAPAKNDAAAAMPTPAPKKKFFGLF